MKTIYREYKDYIENILGLVIIFAIIAVGFKYFDIETIQTYVDRAGIWAPLVLILAKASTMIFAPVSGSPLYPLAGALFGFWQGSLYLVLGDLIGATISFKISRMLGRRAVERFARGNVPVIDKILAFMETTRGFLIARICFVALPEAVSYAAGLTRISFARFIVIQTAVGIVPTFILAGAGSWASLTTGTWPMIALGIIGIVVAIAGALVFIKLTKKAAEDKTDIPHS